jgi:hypothetical protein
MKLVELMSTLEHFPSLSFKNRIVFRKLVLFSSSGVKPSQLGTLKEANVHPLGIACPMELNLLNDFELNYTKYWCTCICFKRCHFSNI